MVSLLSSLRCVCRALRSRWSEWLPRCRRRAGTPRHREPLRDAEEGESKAHASTPNRPFRDIKGSKVHAPVVHLSIPNRPHDESLHDTEEQSKADVPPRDRPLPDAKERSKVNAPKSKRRALLVGITYKSSTDEVWTPLEHPHDDVDNFRELLIRVFSIIRVSSCD